MKFIDPSEIPPPDFYVDAGESWECPCGGLKIGPVTSGGVISLACSLTWWCPSCGSQVEQGARVRGEA